MACVLGLGAFALPSVAFANQGTAMNAFLMQYPGSHETHYALSATERDSLETLGWIEAGCNERLFPYKASSLSQSEQALLASQGWVPLSEKPMRFARSDTGAESESMGMPALATSASQLLVGGTAVIISSGREERS